MTVALDTPVPLLQRDGELERVLDLYALREPKRVLEVGTLHGGTLYHWLRQAAPDASVVAVDLTHPNAHLYSEWTPDGADAVAIVGNSHDPNVIEQVAGHAPFDWIYIDAGHRYPEVRADWDNYRALAAPGAVVLLHDIFRDYDHPHIEVWQLWAEIRPSFETDEIGLDTGVVYL